MASSSHEVVLIAPSGREQAATLRISKQGISLATPDKELNRFPFEVIVKWLPSNLRSRNPGTADCLDLQIMTDKGPRDLRMRCGNETAVQNVMDHIQATVQEVMQDEGLATATPSISQNTAHGPALQAQQQIESPASTSGAAGMTAATAIPVKIVGGPPAASSAPPTSSAPPYMLLPIAGGQSAQLVSTGHLTQLQQVLPDAPQYVQVLPSGVQQIIPQQQALMQQLYSQGYPPQLPFPLQQPEGGRGTSEAPGITTATHPMLQPGMAYTLTQDYAGGALGSLGGGGTWPWLQPGTQAPLHPQSIPSFPVQPAARAQAPSATAHASMQSVAEVETVPDPAMQEALQAAQVEAQSLTRDMQELAQQNQFLEDLVNRLAAEVSRRQLDAAEADPSQDPRELALGLPEVAGVPLPPWLQDRRYLNPLLAAYDERVGALEKQLGQRADSLETLQRQVGEVLAENERMRAELDIQERAASRAAAGGSGGSGQQQQVQQERVALLLEENALLRRENDMLLAQQIELDTELQRLHRSMEEHAMEAVAAARESASAASRVHTTEEAAVARVHAAERAAEERVQAVESAAVERVQEVEKVALDKVRAMERSARERVQAAEAAAAAGIAGAQEGEQRAMETMKDAKAKLSRCQASLRAAEHRASELDQELQAVRSRLEDEAAGAAVARRALDDSRQQCAVQEAELAALGQRCRAAVEGQATLQVELTSVREKYEEAAGEVAAGQRQLEVLMSAVNMLEQRVADYQKNDAEVYTRVKDAMEEAEQARLARDSALMMQREMQKEVDVLKERLAALRQATRDTAYAELQGQLHESAERLQLAQEESAAAVQQATELRTINDRLHREVRSLTSELTAFKASLQSGEALAGGAHAAGAAAGGSGSSKVQMSLMSMAAMERMQDLERSRDEASQKLESTERYLERLARNWQLERQTLEVEVRELRQKLADAESQLLARRNDIAGLSRQVDTMARELQASVISRSRFEEEARAQSAAARTERDQEVRALASKLESAVTASNRNLAEAERVIEAKEALVAQWREEAQTIASKMERAAVDHRRQLAEHSVEASGILQQLEGLKQEHNQVLMELNEARSAVSHLRAVLEDADARGVALGMQLMAAQGKEEELQAELRALHMALDRTRALAAKDARQAGDASRDQLMAKYAAFKHGPALGMVPGGM